MKKYFSIILVTAVYLQAVNFTSASNCCIIIMDPETTRSSSNMQMINRGLCCSSGCCDKQCVISKCHVKFSKKDSAILAKLKKKEKIEKLHAGIPIVTVLHNEDPVYKSTSIAGNHSSITTPRFFPLRI